MTYVRMLRTMASNLESVPFLSGLVRPVGDLDRLIAANSGRATLRDERCLGPRSISSDPDTRSRA